MVNSIIFKTNLCSKSIINHIQRRFMPVNVPPTATGKRRFRLEVETDPHKLVNYCCGLNYHIDEPMVKLKPDEEYPDWLWTLRMGPKLNSWEMEKGTKEYYLRLAEEGFSQNLMLKKRAAKPTKMVDKALLAQEEYIHHKRFAALAYLEDDIGLDQDTLVDEDVNYYQTRASDYYLPVDEKRVLFQDKIPQNIHLKNFDHDEENSFRIRYKPISPPPPKELKATLDRKQRHRYSVF